MKAWRELNPGRKLLYLAAMLLPVMGLFPFLHQALCDRKRSEQFFFHLVGEGSIPH